MLLDQVQDLGFLGLLRVFGDWQVVEFDAVGLRQWLELWVVGHDHGDLDRELACFLSEEQVVQAVPDLGHHDEDLWFGGYGP